MIALPRSIQAVSCSLRARLGRTLAVLSLTIATTQTASAQAATPATPANKSAAAGIVKPTIVLVHGALTDAMSWSRVIPLLQRDGYYVIAVENPLSSLEADVATTKRVIDAQKGPVVVVGHSYGGAVISSAAAGNANVSALVYVAALAPDSGDVVSAMLDKYPSPLSTAFIPDAIGYLYVDRTKLRDVFAADLPVMETAVLGATQKPINSAIFTTAVTAAAWKQIPSWYLVARNDRAVSPELQRLLAKRMRATTVEVSSSHLAMLSRPADVARLIEQAARGARRSSTSAAH